MRYVHRSKTRLSTAVFLALVVASCAQNLPPKVTPEGQVAIYARQAMTLADGVLTELDHVTELRLANATTDADKERIKSQTRQAAAVLVKVGQAGKDLSVALQVWSTAHHAIADQTAAAVKVRAILDTIQKLIPQITALIPDANTRAVLATALQAVSDLVLNVQGLVPAPVSP